MNKLVYYLDQTTNKKIQLLRVFEAFIFFLTLIVLSVEYFYLFSKTRKNFRILFKRFKIKSHLNKFFLKSNEHYFSLVTSDGSILDTNSAWKNTHLPQINEDNNIFETLNIDLSLMLKKQHLTKVRTNTNDIKIISWKYQPLEGEPLYYLWGYDTTEEQIAKEKLLHTNKIQFLGKAAAGLAHEINNPLTFIKTNLEYLKLTNGKNESSFPETYDSIQKGVSRIDEIIQSFRLTTYGLSSEKNVEPISSSKSKANLKSVVETSLKMALVTTEKNFIINNYINQNITLKIEEGP